MFKMLDPKFFAVVVAWTTVLIVMGINVVAPVLEVFGFTPKLSWAVVAVQVLVTLILITPAWKWVWRKVPILNRWFPDLSGDWDVEVLSNWPRIDATLRAANGERPLIDTRGADDATLPPLGNSPMRARIHQSWVSIRINLWNPANNSPIDESKSLMVEPFRGDDGRHGLIYVFEQGNRPEVVSDDRSFMGAARVAQDRDNPNVLCGHMWTDRMWRRGMNTAAEIRMTRRP